MQELKNSTQYEPLLSQHIPLKQTVRPKLTVAVLITRPSFNKCLLTMAVVHDPVATPDFLLLSVLAV